MEDIEIGKIITDKEFSEKMEYMLVLENKINTELGFRFWNKYVSAAFWGNISMPLNLSITMMTALSTGQAATDHLLPKPLYVNISVATLVISVLNTYFRPHIQMNKNLEMLNKWNELGCEFEEIFYSESSDLGYLNTRIERYDELLRKLNSLKKTENLETQNFVTDIIYTILRSCECCLKNKSSWLSLDNTLKSELDKSPISLQYHKIRHDVPVQTEPATEDTPHRRFLPAPIGKKTTASSGQ